MRPNQPNLLRRTAMALAAVAAFAISLHSEAAVVTLNGVSGNSCSYSSMAVQPDGSFSVSCSAPQTGPTTPTPGSFFLNNQADVAPSAMVQMTAFRSGGASGAVSVQYVATGNGCANGGGTVSWTDGDTNGKTFPIAMLLTGSCTVALQNPTGGATLASPASVTFNISAAAGGGVNCPTGYSEPQGLANMTLGGLGNPLLAMASSNQVVSLPLPAVQPGASTGNIAFSESAGGAYTPQPVTLYISISKCKGLIDTDTSNRCNIISTNGNYNSMTWFAQAYSIIKDQASANLRGYCWAPSSEGPWYINSKWSYSQCAFGAQICGFAVQQNPGPY